MKLYKHQKIQNKAIKKALKQKPHILYGASTGFGKSVCILDIVKKGLANDLRILVLAPYRKLIFQLETTFSNYAPRVIMCQLDRGSLTSDLVLTSMDTMNSRLRKGSKVFEGFNLIIIDEVHISCNFPPLDNTRMKLLYDKYWDKAKWIGFSATPIKANGYRLEGWDKSIYKYNTRWLIDNEFLAEYVYHAPKEINLSDLRVRAGEYLQSDVEEVTNTPSAIKSVKKLWKKKCKVNKVLIFASSIHHAELLQESIKGSTVIHSKLKEFEIQKTLDSFECVKTGVLINVNMLTTGFNDPSIDVVILARPIQSIRTYLQCVGRGLRKYGDKVCTIYDMCSCYKKCGLPTDPRDWNKVKGVTEKREQGDEITAMKCDLCDAVSPTGAFEVVKSMDKNIQTTEYYCPECSEMCKIVTGELIKVDKMVEIKQTKAKVLLHKERKQIVGEFISEFTKAKISWSHFIVGAITSTGREELLDYQIARDVTDKTKWTNIMKIFEDAKNDK